MSDLMAALEALTDAEPAYAKAENYYNGDVGEVMCSDDLLTRKLAKTGEQFRINLAKTPVNVVADRLEIAAVTVPGDDAATKMLQEQVWDANQLLLETPDINRKALTYGDGYLMVWPDDAQGVNVMYNGPRTTRLFYDPENPRRKVYAIKSWVEGPKDNRRRRATLYYPDRIERWVTVDRTDGTKEEDWVEFVEEGRAWPEPNPYNEVPIFHLRTTSPYGVPEHKDAYGPQDAFTKTNVVMMALIEFLGYPPRVFLAHPSAGVEAGQFSPTFDDDAQADGSHVRRVNMPVGPGRDIVGDENLRDVKQLNPAEVSNFLETLQFVMRAMAQTTTTPSHYFDPQGDAPSGESLRTAEAPLVKKIRYRQMRFAAAYAEALSFALKVLGRAGLKVDVRWVPATSTDDKDAWETAGLKLAAGVPVRQVLLEMGYTSEQVEVWLSVGDEDDLRELLVRAAEFVKAAKDAGAAQALGSVTPEQNAAIFGPIAERLALPAEAMAQAA